MKEITEKKTITEKISDAIDAVLTPFAPRTVLKRKMDRFALGRASAYRSAQKTRRNENWKITPGSADEDLLPDLPTLRERSRDLNRNDAHAAGITAMIVTNVVGVGIRPQSRVDNEDINLSEGLLELFQKSAERSWKRWVEVSDAAGVLDFYGIQHLVERQILENGEVFVIPLMLERNNSPYMLRLQVVEADRVETPAELKSNKNVRSGIEIDEHGQPVAYYVRKSHPGDRIYRTDQSGNSIKNFIRYPARNEIGRPNIFHLYYQKRPGQTRGEPFFTPVINYFKDLSDYMEAELTAAKVAACFSVFVKRNNSASFSVGNTNRIENNKRIEMMEPGIIEYLQPDEDVAFANPNRPGSNFSPFIVQMLRSIAAALNMPFEVVIRDFTGSSYSSARAALMEARRFFRERQKFLERELCQPVWEMFLEEAWLIGELPPVKFYQDRLALTNARWISPGWGWIDPTKEVDSARSAVEGLMSTHSSQIGQMGDDWEEVFEQLAREKKKMKDLGLIEKATTQKKTLIETKDSEEEPDPAVPGKKENQ